MLGLTGRVLGRHVACRTFVATAAATRGRCMSRFAITGAKPVSKYPFFRQNVRFASTDSTKSDGVASEASGASKKAAEGQGGKESVVEAVKAEDGKENDKKDDKDGSKDVKDSKDVKKKVKKRRIRNFLAGFKIREQPAGNIVGTVNDPYKPPEMDLVNGSYHWVYERAILVTMLPLMVVPCVAGVDHPFVDATFMVMVLLHSRYGFHSCITDYIPKRVYGSWNTAANRLLDFGTWVSLYGCYLIETEQNGFFNMIYQFWTAAL